MSVSTTTRAWRTAMVSLLAVVTLSGVTLGCSSSDSDDAAVDTTIPPPTSVPEECKNEAEQILAESTEADPEAQGAPGSEQPELSPQCADALFAVTVQEQGSDALKELPSEEQLGFAHGMCAYAVALTSDEAVAPSFDELVASTSESWGVEPVLVEEIISLATVLCPGQLTPVLDLQSGRSALTLRLQVTGGGRALVAYQGPDGASMQDEVATPWDHEIRLEVANDYRLTARIPDGEVVCSIMVGDTVIVETEGGVGEQVECAATAAELREAAL